MDAGIFVAIAMLAVWTVGTFFYDAPGWLHLLLTAGVFLLIWRIVVRGNASGKGRPNATNGHGRTRD